jgi:NAD+ synthase
MDALMRGHSEGVAAAELAPEVGLSPDEVEAAYAEIERRREATRYLHAPAIVPEEVG